MEISARVVADSKALSTGIRLTSVEVVMPRFLLAEFNTHRVFSRNSASSRAIPVERRLIQIRDEPFVPGAFARNKPGMQAGEALDERDASKARDAWLAGRDAAIAACERLLDAGVHKQWANRLLEPFAWHTVLVTSTEWSNFFALRMHPAAQPEMQAVAAAMHQVMFSSTAAELDDDEWHLPYVDAADAHALSDADLVRVSVARCALQQVVGAGADPQTLREGIRLNPRS